MSEGDLTTCVKQFIAEHRSLRDAAKVLGVDHGYLSRLANGGAQNPGDGLLDAMGIQRTIVYQRVKK